MTTPQGVGDERAAHEEPVPQYHPEGQRHVRTQERRYDHGTDDCGRVVPRESDGGHDGREDHECEVGGVELCRVRDAGVDLLTTQGSVRADVGTRVAGRAGEGPGKYAFEGLDEHEDAPAVGETLVQLVHGLAGSLCSDDGRDDAPEPAPPPGSSTPG